MHDSKRKLHIAITVLVMAFIFVQSALPGDLSGAQSNFFVRFLRGLIGVSEEQLSFFIRKAAHFTEYMILGGCLAVNARDWFLPARMPVRGGVAAWMIGAVYAVSDEVHQYFVPGRACAVMDMCIDAAGVATGILVVMWYMARRHTARRHTTR
jgi:VanZ family protein